jgi:DNA-binding NarL/FixJ family response regulator
VRTERGDIKFRTTFGAPAEANRSSARSLRVERRELLVAVDANDALHERIATVLEGDGIAIVDDDSPASVDLRVVAVDLSQSVSLRRLKTILTRRDEPVVAVSPYCGALGLRRAVKAGADSLVLEHELEDALVPAVRAVAAGLTVMPSGLWNGAERVALSHREREVLRLAVTGRTNSEIASTLFLAESTVKSHLSSAYRKLGAGGRNDAASMIFDPDGGLADMVLRQDAVETVPGDVPAA